MTYEPEDRLICKHAINMRLIELGKQLGAKGVRSFSISSKDWADFNRWTDHPTWSWPLYRDGEWPTCEEAAGGLTKWIEARSVTVTPDSTTSVGDVTTPTETLTGALVLTQADLDASANDIRRFMNPGRV